MHKYAGRDMGLEIARGVRGRISLLNQRTFSSLKNPVFRLYFFGMTGQWASMNMQMITRSLLIYRLTGSAAILGVMSLAHALPMVLLSLVGGAIADRFQKKYVLLVGMAGEAVVALGVALALTLGYLSAERTGSWWILMVASFFQGIVMGLMMPSRQAIISEIVSKEQLMNAVALNNLGMNTVRLVAPALAGFFIDALSFEAVYYIMTGMYLIGAAFITFMPLTSTITTQASSALTNIKEGVRYVQHETTILLILVFTLFGVILSMPYLQLMPVFTDDILKVGATGMGILISVSSIGSAAGSLAIASLPNKKRGLILLVSSLVLGLALVGFSFSRSWYLSLALIIFVGLGQTGRMTLSNILLQSYTADGYLGRVMSFFMMNMGLQSLGTFFAGLMTEVVGVEWSVGSLAMVLALLSVMMLVFVSRIRKLD